MTGQRKAEWSRRRALQFTAVLLVIISVTGCQFGNGLRIGEARRIADAFVKKPGLPAGLRVGPQWDASDPDRTSVSFDVASANHGTRSLAWAGSISVDVQSRRVSRFDVDIEGKAPAWKALPVSQFSHVGKAFAMRAAPEVFHGPGQLASDFAKGIPPGFPNRCSFWRVDRGWRVPVWVDAYVAMDGMTVCRYSFGDQPYKIPGKVISEDKAIFIAQRAYQGHSGRLPKPNIPVSRVVFGPGKSPTWAGHACYMVIFGGGHAAVPGGGTVGVPSVPVIVDAVTGEVLQ